MNEIEIRSVDQAIAQAKEIGCVKYKIFFIKDQGDPLHMYFFDENNIEKCYYTIPFKSFRVMSRSWDDVFLHSKHMSKFYEIEEGNILSKAESDSTLCETKEGS